MPLPTEFEFFDSDDKPFRVRFDHDRGEDQWFDARAGVGSPGYPAEACITEVNFGAGWESPDVYPQLDREAIEQEILEKLADCEAAENAARDEAEYAAFQEWKKQP